MKKAERIIDFLKPHFDEVEVLYQEGEEYTIGFENSQFSYGTGNDTTAYAIRAIKNGKMAFTVSNSTNKKNLKKVLETLKELVETGTPVEFSFNKNSNYEEVKHYAPSIKKTTSSQMYEEGMYIINKIKEKQPDATINVTVSKGVNILHYANSNGIYVSDKGSAFSTTAYLLYPGMGMGVGTWSSSLKKFRISSRKLNNIVKDYRIGLNGFTPQSGKMPVIFTPRGLFAVVITLIEGISAENVIRGISPLKDKIGERIFSEKFTVKDMPIENTTHARRFDDEGVPCFNKVIIERGTLKMFINDLKTAHQLNTDPTGNGFKRAMFGGGIEAMPHPYMANCVIEKGNITINEIIKDIKEGIIVEHLMGFHSSNYLAGEITGQISGFYIKDGKVKGRVDGAMISMNIYQDMKNIEVSSETDIGYLGSSMPYIMVKDVNITGR